MVGSFYNPSGQVTVTIGTRPGTLNVVACQVQTAEGTDNIFTPCLYTAAVIRILTNDTTLYTESLIGAEVTLSSSKFYWHGKVVSNCSNMDYNQDLEEIEIQAVDDLTLAKSIEYAGPKVGTPNQIITACMPAGVSVMYAKNLTVKKAYATPRPVYGANDYSDAMTSANISLVSVLAKDESERVTCADVLSAVLRYLSLRCLGYAYKTFEARWCIVFASVSARVHSGTTWITYRDGTPDVIPYPDVESITLGTPSNPYRGTAQVSLLDPYKSYCLTSHFPAIEIEDETYETVGQDDYQLFEIGDNDTTEYGFYGVIQKYKKGSQSQYFRYTYKSSEYPNYQKADEIPTLTQISSDIKYSRDVTSYKQFASKTNYVCGAIHVSSAYGSLEGRVDPSIATTSVSPAGSPDYNDAIMLYGLQDFARGVTEANAQSTSVVGAWASSLYGWDKVIYGPKNYIELYRRTMDVLVLSSKTKQAYLLVNATFRPTYKHYYWFYSTINNDLDWATAIRMRTSYWQILCRLYLTDDKNITTEYPILLDFDISGITKCHVSNKDYQLKKDTKWSDGLESDGFKIELPDGAWTRIAFGIGIPQRMPYDCLSIIADNTYCSYCYISNLSFNLEYSKKENDGDTDTDTKYGWNNDGLQIDGNEVEEETNIVTADGKNISPNIVTVDGNYDLAALSDALTDEEARPEQHRVDLFARQYETSTISVTTTLGGPPMMLGTYKTVLSDCMTVEAYSYDLATDLTEVTLVQNKI